MSQYDLEIARLSKDICGKAIENAKCDAFLDISLQRLDFKEKNVASFNELLEILCLDEVVVKNLCLVQLLLQYGEILCNMKIIQEDYFQSIFKVKYYSNIRVTKENGSLQYLLMKGLDNRDCNCWKYLEVLSQIMNRVIRSKSALTSIIKDDFASNIGNKLDSTTDLQSLNYVVELLSNCFPRKYFERPGVISPPTLWFNEDTKNKLFFNKKSYPFRGKCGDEQTLQFIWELFSEKLKVNTSQIKHITYTTESDKNKNTLSALDDRLLKIVQVCKSSVYIWIADTCFFTINRKYSDVVLFAKNKLKISISDITKALSVIRISPDINTNFSKISTLQLELQNKNEDKEFRNSIYNVPKISEVSAYLQLRNCEAYENTYKTPEISSSLSDANEIHITDTGHSKTPKELEMLLSESFPPVSQVEKKITKGIQKDPFTPDNSNANLITDKWEISNASNQLDDPIDTNISANVPTKRKKSYNIEDNETSPIVLLQQNKLRRTTRNNDSKFTSSIMVLDEKKIEQKTDDNKMNDGIKKLLMNKDKNRDVMIEPKLSIQPKDIQLLDAIFSKPIKKAVKRQQKLNIPPSGKKRKINQVKKNPVKKVESKVSESEKVASKKVKSPILEAPNIYTSKEGEDMLEKKQSETTKKEQNRNKSSKLAKKITEPTIQEADKNKTFRTSAGVMDTSKKIKESNKKLNKPESKMECTLTEEVTKENPVERERSIHVNKLIDKTSVVVQPTPNIDENNQSINAESTTLINSSTDAHSLGNMFTIQLQNQIADSISKFSNDITKKIDIINSELNNRFITEISQKYQNLINDLQRNFQKDTQDMLDFVGDIKNLINLPDDQFQLSIRNKKFNHNS
ncbi:hypothetical protein TPHA_0J00560 [Tetrapisispora phaffii CBS 4417]|uniref:Uncharacterized protein n=1 Tax=Tetrapisispora phaffii (strain ATCC 24235 / CBS 4417 / NBRC 1672 / NRRL Y-8282 / UCD 70-5) TaxID=1071381 RepID=G8BYD7_TETPH|nr:hypothetical protein TPHA_0J00560 [Tetrapisispora phaffii CBS 4417]CCE64879.1 hypothetical protein TPHA_0J00560 [Tetrapisispora phaffii CBS 4417]